MPRTVVMNVAISATLSEMKSGEAAREKSRSKGVKLEMTDFEEQAEDEQRIRAIAILEAYRASNPKR